MKNTKRWLAACLLVVVLAVTHPTLAPAHDGRGFNDEYVFATTRSVNEMDMNPALKLTLFPVTVVLDIALLPFALIAGAVTS